MLIITHSIAHMNTRPNNNRAFVNRSY